jgi:hypothetical protein
MRTVVESKICLDALSAPRICFCNERFKTLRMNVSAWNDGMREEVRVQNSKCDEEHDSGAESY